MTEPAIETDHLTVGYGSGPVARDVSLAVWPGELVALLGPNAAGKTTTLLTMSGLLPSLGGRVRMLGREVAGMRPEAIARLGVAHMPQDRALFPDLTVREHLRLAQHRGRSDPEAVLNGISLLKPLVGRRVGVLSGGEQQLVALARAMVGQPQVVLVDELSTGLAPVLVGELYDWLRTIARDRGVAVLAVEEHLALALAHADRCYVLASGHIVAAGPPKAIADRRELLEMAYLGGQVL